MLYILLTRVTDRGQQRLLENPDLLNKVCEEIDVPHTQLLARYAVLGQYDYVLIAEAVDSEAMARLSMELGARCGMHIETLQAISVGVLSQPWERDAIPEFPTAQGPGPEAVG